MQQLVFAWRVGVFSSPSLCSRSTVDCPQHPPTVCCPISSRRTKKRVQYNSRRGECRSGFVVSCKVCGATQQNVSFVGSARITTCTTSFRATRPDPRFLCTTPNPPCIVFAARSAQSYSPPSRAIPRELPFGSSIRRRPLRTRSACGACAPAPNRLLGHTYEDEIKRNVETSTVLDDGPDVSRRRPSRVSFVATRAYEPRGLKKSKSGRES